MKEIPTALAKAGIGLVVVAATPFVARAATDLAEKESWQWWNKDSKDAA
jgi:hypothetical protein